LEEKEDVQRGLKLAPMVVGNCGAKGKAGRGGEGGGGNPVVLQFGTEGGQENTENHRNGPGRKAYGSPGPGEERPWSSAEKDERKMKLAARIVK